MRGFHPLIVVGLVAAFTARIASAGEAMTMPAAPVAPRTELAKAPTLPPDDLGKPGSVEIQTRRLSDKLATAFKDKDGGGRYERWAVVPFSEHGEDVQKRRLGEVVAAQVEGTLKNDHGFICVERMKLAEVVKELQLAQAGLIDEAKAPKVGELAGADVLVVGSVGMLGDRYVVNARAVSASEGKVLAAAQVTIEAKGLVALSSDALVLRTRSDAVFRSLLVPGWGQLYNRQDQKGGLIMFAGGSLLAGGLTFYLLGSSAETEYKLLDPQRHKGVCDGRVGEQFSVCVENQRQVANDRYSTSNTLFAAFGLVYAYNLLDAWLFGYTPDESTRSLYATGLPSIDVLPNGVAVSGAF